MVIYLTHTHEHAHTHTHQILFGVNFLSCRFSLFFFVEEKEEQRSEMNEAERKQREEEEQEKRDRMKDEKGRDWKGREQKMKEFYGRRKYLKFFLSEHLRRSLSLWLADDSPLSRRRGSMTHSHTYTYDICVCVSSFLLHQSVHQSFLPLLLSH